MLSGKEEAMFEIKGKINTAVCYSTVVEDGAIEQIRRMCDYELTKDPGYGLCQMSMPVRDVRLEQL